MAGDAAPCRVPDAGDASRGCFRPQLEMHKSAAGVVLGRCNESSYAAADDIRFASDKKKGKQPRLASMIAEDYIRPAAEKLGIRPEGCRGFGLHNCRHELSTWMIDCATEPPENPTPGNRSRMAD